MQALTRMYLLALVLVCALHFKSFLFIKYVDQALLPLFVDPNNLDSFQRTISIAILLYNYMEALLLLLPLSVLCCAIHFALSHLFL